MSVFYVPGSEAATQFVQKKQYLMLIELDRLCREHDITYFLSCGTLLGAIRHNGPIPWDDDLDVGMLRCDYDRFISLAPKYINNRYYIQTWETDVNYALPHCKIRDLKTHYIETVSSKSGCVDGVSIDVLPYDNIPDTRFMQIIHGHILYEVLNLIKVKRKWTFIKENNISSVKLFFYELVSKHIQDKQLLDIHNKISLCFNNSNKRYVSEVAGLDYFRFVVRRDCYKNLREYKYLENYFFIPKAYDDVLTNAYGDYMKLPDLADRKGQPGVECIIGEDNDE